jgi:hypothetical protein
MDGVVNHLATLLADLAEFEREPIGERTKIGSGVARTRAQTARRRADQTPDREASADQLNSGLKARGNAGPFGGG